MELSKAELDVLRAIAKAGRPASSSDPALTQTMKDLCAKKLLKSQTFLHREESFESANAKINVAYSLTAAGNKELSRQPVTA